MEQIITRFPPSPTGYLHVGGARTALFNWLYARHNKGKFVLRIEDTDIKRSTKESVDAIFEALEWLQIDWDDGPYFQSRRFQIYAEYIPKLISSGHAYYCTCTPEELEAMRKNPTMRLFVSRRRFRAAPCWKMSSRAALLSTILRWMISSSPGATGPLPIIL